MGADANVQLPVDGAGKRLRVYGPLPGNGGADFIEGVYESDVDGNFAASPEDPKSSVLSSTNLAAGASVTLQGALVTTARSGRLEGVLASASVPLKVQVQALDGGATDRAVFFVRGFVDRLWRPPHKSYERLTGDGARRWQVVVTNLEVGNAANVYATIYWDEVTP